MTIDEFKRIELRIGKVTAAERIEGSEKLVKLTVDLGEKDVADLPHMRQVVAGIGKSYTQEELVGKEIVVVANLEPRTLMGVESQGMLLAASGETGEPVILIPEKEVSVGAEVK